MAKWISSFDFFSLALKAIITILTIYVSISIGHYLKKPKLAVTGSSGSGGSGTGFHTYGITITNVPGFIGILLERTTIFGFRIHNYIKWGFTFDRNPSHECKAFIREKGSKEIVRLFWRKPHDDSMVETVTLNSGEQATLMIFARKHDDGLKYFIYHEDDKYPNHPKIPSDDLKYNSTEEFIIEIHHSYGSKFKIRLKMVKGIHGRLMLYTKYGRSSF